MPSPIQCNYAPPGEYIKDHSLIYYDGRWHLFSISGTAGYSHLFSGNEETVSWSVSENLVDWDFRGHVLHASLRDGEFDQHEIWAPYCLSAYGRFYMFYAGIRHPCRPMCYEKLGTHHPNVIWKGHCETLGMAVSDDLTCWTKISDREHGIGVPGRDPHVVRDEENGRWLLYTTGMGDQDYSEELVSESADLLNWRHVGVCARFPQGGFPYSTTESICVLRHPLDGRWIMLGNWHYALSDNPMDFTGSAVSSYIERENTALGFAGEIIEHGGKWYRSGVLGVMDHWVLGFHEIEWERGGAFRVVGSSAVKWQF